VWLDIHPAPGETPAQQIQIVLAQRLQRRERDALGFRDAENR